MPACRDCPQFDASAPVCRIKNHVGHDASNPEARPLSRACVTAIMLKYLPELSARSRRDGPTGRILEIGPGVFKGPRRIIRQHGARWHGIDPHWRRPSQPGAYHGTVGKLPFPDEYFDAVFGLETMEHWNEKGNSPAEGLDEIARVLVPGGSVLLTVPIHQHGGIEFVAGDVGLILSAFGKAWAHVEHERWRFDYDPLPASEEWRYWNNGRYANLVTVRTEQTKPSSWTLELRAWKRVCREV